MSIREVSMTRRHVSLVDDDIRRILKLVNHLHALPSDGTGRRRAMLEGLCEMVSADVGESAILGPGGEVRAGEGREPLWVGTNGRAPGLILAGGGGGGERGEGVDLAVGQLIRGLGEARGQDVMTVARRQFAGEGHRDAIYSARVVSARSGEVGVVCVERRRGRRGQTSAMGAREARLVHLLHSETGWVYDGAGAAEEEADGLTARQRECLRQLLRGRSEKQIASDLRLSPHTVHCHVKAVYRRLKVSTRAELMARQLGNESRRGG